MRLAPVGGAGFSARAARRSLGQPARKRRGLAVHGPAGCVQLVFEPFDLLAQSVALPAVSITLPFHTLALAAQSFILALLQFKFGDQILSGCGSPARSHGLVMPRFDRNYKWKPRRGRRLRLEGSSHGKKPRRHV